MSMRTCPNCEAQVEAEAEYCDNCGAPLPKVAVEGANVAPGVCPNCFATVQPGAQFCDNCGHKLPFKGGYPTNPQLIVDDLEEPDFQPVDDDAGAAGIEGDIVLRGESVPSSASPGIPRLVVQPGGTVLMLPLDQETCIIGREDPASGSYPEIDLVPFGGEEGGVSRRHARISRDGRQYFIEDLNSVNYTFVNRHKIPVATPYRIHDGDEIRFGRVLVRFRTE